jgi:RNA polymerase sigma-70 factor (ECF subfamily)
LSEIPTNWPIVSQAVRGSGAESLPSIREAQAWLWSRYAGAVRRYLRGLVQNADAAEELCQEFAVRLIRGDFGGLDPRHGRFRNYLKSALFHLVVDHLRRRRAAPVSLSRTEELAADYPTPDDEAEAKFNESWRDHLFHRTWATLWAEEREKGQPLATVLQLRCDYPDESNGQLAVRVGLEPVIDLS